VNGRLVNLDHKLATGEAVEILTAKRGGPSRDWLNPSLEMVKTQRAISKIRQWFKHEDREQNVSDGRQLLERELRRLGLEGMAYEQIARDLGYAQVDDLLAAIGSGDVNLGKVVSGLAEAKLPELDLPRPLDIETRGGRLAPDEVTILGVSGLLTNIGRCCKPLPGDPIVGYITRGRGATIHRRDCPNMLRVRDKERLVQVSWGQARETYPVSVRIRAYDRDGLMRDVSTLVANEGISMSSIHVSTKSSLAIFDLVMGVTDLNQLSRVLNRLEALPNVLEARRLQPG
jgi:GTP pyrophosphokinase